MERFRTKQGTCSIANSELRFDESYRGQLGRYYEGARSSILGFVLVVGMFTYLLWWFTTTALNARWILPYFSGPLSSLWFSRTPSTVFADSDEPRRFRST